MKGKLIIIEAGDGSGKATQTKALYDHLKADGHKVHRIEFPDYADDSSALVRMYLGGAFGEKAADVTPLRPRLSLPLTALLPISVSGVITMRTAILFWLTAIPRAIWCIRP